MKYGKASCKYIYIYILLDVKENRKIIMDNG